MSKKLFIKTFGCQMNVYDSARMADILMPLGYEQTEELEDADLVIVNTCNIREKAKEKLFSELGKINIAKQNKKDGAMRVVVAGCVAQTEGAKIFKRMPVVDMVVGPEAYHKLPELLQQKEADAELKSLELSFDSEGKFTCLTAPRKVDGVSEFVAIQAGCDKFCSYCIVPYTRGREYSRNADDVLKEIEDLRNKGIREITLLGQNVDNYSYNRFDKKITLADLIYEVAKIDGIERIRYTTSYPSQFTEEIIDAHRDIKKLMPYIHLPVQSGSNTILKAMNRRYSREEYIDLVKRIRAKVKDVALSSDFIVGFPNETEEDFQETISLVKEIGYASSFSFKYSPRPKTPAAKMKGQIDEDLKTVRLEKLQEILDKQQIAFNSSFINDSLEVLVENAVKHVKDTYFGRSPYLQAVIFESEAPVKVGQIVKVKIESATLRTLKGSLTNS